jgi:hypothetical protein
MRAVDLALAGDWESAHAIVQKHEDDATACWMHAVLHKIEGDESNSRYWYSRSSQAYEAYAEPKVELAAIKAQGGTGVLGCSDVRCPARTA